MLNLSLILEDSAIKYASKTAFILDNQHITYEDLNNKSNRIAGYLIENGLQDGDKVALTCPNLLYFPIIYYGILKAGGTVVPLNVLLKPDEVQYYLEDSEAKFHFCFEGSSELPTGQFGLNGFNRTENFYFFITRPPPT